MIFYPKYGCYCYITGFMFLLIDSTENHIHYTFCPPQPQHDTLNFKIKLNLIIICL